MPATFAMLARGRVQEALEQKWLMLQIASICSYRIPSNRVYWSSPSCTWDGRLAYVAGKNESNEPYTIGVVVVTVVVSVVEETMTTGGMLMYELQKAMAEERADGSAVRALRMALSREQIALETAAPLIAAADTEDVAKPKRSSEAE